MTPSTEQTHFYSVVPSGRNYCLRAVAGSGKTTTIVGLCQRLPQPCQPLFLAFNKAVAEELKTRLPFYAKASTFHALCYGALKKQLPTLGKADGRKMAKILKTYVPQVKDRIEWESDYMRLCGVAKAYGYGVLPTCPSLDELAEEYGLIVPDLKLAAQCLTDSLVDRLNIDWDDMLLHALAYNAPFPYCSHLLIDEGQDTNPVQLALAQRIAGPKPDVPSWPDRPTRAQVIVVGDPSQAIYGFRGASSNALANLCSTFDCIELPLSVTWRCAKRIVDEARKWESRAPVGVQSGLPQPITAAEGAAEGSVNHLNHYGPEQFPQNAVVLCRMNAPLVNFAFALIRRKVPCHVLGRDLAALLNNLYERIYRDGMDRPALISRLAQYRDSEIKKLLDRGKHHAAAAVRDTCECLKVFIEQVEPHAVQAQIELLFSENVKGLTLSTVHKSKGLEWPTVFILDPGLLSASPDATEGEKQAAKNLSYVAVTRAQLTLNFIRSGNWK